MTLANLPLGLQSKDEYKLVVGWIPELDESRLTKLGLTKEIGPYARVLIMQRALSILLTPLRKKIGKKTN